MLYHYQGKQARGPLFKGLMEEGPVTIEGNHSLQDLMSPDVILYSSIYLRIRMTVFWANARRQCRLPGTRTCSKKK